jgi:hypothetical protein
MTNAARPLAYLTLVFVIMAQTGANSQTMIDEGKVFPDRLAVYYSPALAVKITSQLNARGVRIDRVIDGCQQFGLSACRPGERRPGLIVRVPVGFTRDFREYLRAVPGIFDVQRVSIADMLSSSQVLIEDPEREAYAHNFIDNPRYDKFVFFRNPGASINHKLHETRNDKIARILASIDIEKTIEFNSNPYALKFDMQQQQTRAKIDLAQTLVEFLKERLAGSSRLSVRKTGEHQLITEFVIADKSQTDLEKRVRRNQNEEIELTIRLIHFSINEKVSLFLVIEGVVKKIKKAIRGSASTVTRSRIEDNPDILSSIKASFEELSDEIEAHLQKKGLSIIEKKLKDKHPTEN